jgi:hypothetical protein
MTLDSTPPNRNNKLESLNLRFNNIGNVGAISLGDALKYNQFLVSEIP